MSVLTRLRRWLRGGAEVLDPAQSDVRAVGPSEPPRETEGTRPGEPRAPEPPEHVSPDAKELEREHRGY
jgi:hypothetical protein